MPRLHPAGPPLPPSALAPPGLRYPPRRHSTDTNPAAAPNPRPSSIHSRSRPDSIIECGCAATTRYERWQLRFNPIPTATRIDHGRAAAWDSPDEVKARLKYWAQAVA
ncbi:hypothetical protein U9M48_022726 [Paspalum notatum var. saurae]|uniref:Uncharacterized protein n=1 Tax=Paspalum notatum var. saurae TaxID=547442 RepID=A0AAQ3TIT4_PASNO